MNIATVDEGTSAEFIIISGGKSGSFRVVESFVYDGSTIT